MLPIFEPPTISCWSKTLGTGDPGGAELRRMVGGMQPTPTLVLRPVWLTLREIPTRPLGRTVHTLAPSQLVPLVMMAIPSLSENIVEILS